jgi:hypothetical protein
MSERSCEDEHGEVRVDDGRGRGSRDEDGREVKGHG